jgi:hypothetical protein
MVFPIERRKMKKKKKKKKVVKSVKNAETNNDTQVAEKKVTLRVSVNKASKSGGEKVTEKTYGVSIFPKDVPLSLVRVRTSGTFNMGNYNSIQAAVEIEDVTISNPKARKALIDTLSEEAVEENRKLAKEVATRFFNRDLEG